MFFKKALTKILKRKYMPESIFTKNTIEPAYRDTKDNLLLKFNSNFFEGDKQLRLRTVRMGSAQSSNFPMCTFWFYCPCFGSFCLFFFFLRKLLFFRNGMQPVGILSSKSCCSRQTESASVVDS